ncbi:MAG: HAD hydrolase-like protein [Nitrospirae bacterium]|nr:HAD hydrolase-like protein [Nitrospirota bacterium]
MEDNNILSIDPELWKTDRYLSTLRDDSAWVELLSIDIFDTLVLRTCLTPGDVFLETGKRAIERGLLRAGMNPREFQHIRQQVGHRVFQEKRAELPPSEETINCIYEMMPDTIGNMDEILNLEIKVEEDFAYTNPIMISLIKYFKDKGKPVALLTDMYLKNGHIEGILRSAGFPLEWANLILVSNEAGANKGSGAMFEKMMSNFPHINRRAALHIGDNPRSDIAGAERAGIRHILYGYDKGLDTVFNWEGVRYEEVLPETSQLRKLASRLNVGDIVKDTPWFSIGAVVLGQFFSAFADWAVDICIKEDRHRVFPIMRGGTLFAEMIEKAARHRGFELTATPLYVSRQTTAFAAIEDFNEFEAEYLFIRRNLKVGKLFQLLELPEGLKEFLGFSDTFIQDTGTTATCWSLKRKLLDYLTRHDIKERLNALIKKHRDILIAYLRQTCGELDGIVTIDFGFQGTIQNYIHYALKLDGIDAAMTHLVCLGEESLRLLILNGIDIRGFSGSAGENLDMIRKINRSPAAIEDLILEGIGTTIGYERQGSGHIVPVLEKNLIPDDEIAKKSSCVKGILAFQDMWFHFKYCKPDLASALVKRKRQLIAQIHRIVDMPIPEEAQLLSTLHHEDNYGSDSAAPICKGDDNKLLDELGPEKFMDYTRYGFKYGNVLWPQGVVSLKYPTYIFQRYSALNNSLNYFSMMNDMVTLMLNEGIGECLVYGAGEIGLTLLHAAEINGLSVINIVDANRNLWGERINGIEVVSLSEAITKQVHTYAVASHIFAIEIVKTIEETYGTLQIKPRIYCAPWYF